MSASFDSDPTIGGKELLWHDGVLGNQLFISPDDPWQRFVTKELYPMNLSARVLEACRAVDRRLFAGEHPKVVVETDSIVHLKDGSTISQPSLVAQMIDLLNIAPGDRVLDIGTASGYQAALIARLAGEVETVEIDQELAESAAERLDRLGYSNVHVTNGDGLSALAGRGPFDAIIVSAGVRELPTSLLDLLAGNGRLILPIGTQSPFYTLTLVNKADNGDTAIKQIKTVYFVPLKSTEQGGWSEQQLGSGLLGLFRLATRPTARETT